MLTTIRLVFSLVILFQTLAIGVSAQATTVVEEKPSLTMTVKSVQNVFNTGGDIPFDIVIKNTSDRPVNMLNAFEEATERSIFFRVLLLNGEETPVFQSGVGKIAFSKESMKYSRLDKDEELTVRINLKDYLVRSNQVLKSGSYTLLVDYFNQYGDNCFRGGLKSQPLIINLID